MLFLPHLATFAARMLTCTSSCTVHGYIVSSCVFEVRAFTCSCFGVPRVHAACSRGRLRFAFRAAAMNLTADRAESPPTHNFRFSAAGQKPEVLAEAHCLSLLFLGRSTKSFQTEDRDFDSGFIRAFSRIASYASSSYASNMT